MTQNMERMTSSIADGFALLNRTMYGQVQPMAQTTATYHPHAYATAYSRQMPSYPLFWNFTAHSQEFDDHENQ